MIRKMVKDGKYYVEFTEAWLEVQPYVTYHRSSLFKQCGGIIENGVEYVLYEKFKKYTRIADTKNPRGRTQQELEETWAQEDAYFGNFKGKQTEKVTKVEPTEEVKEIKPVKEVKPVEEVKEVKPVEKEAKAMDKLKEITSQKPEVKEENLPTAIKLLKLLATEEGWETTIVNGELQCSIYKTFLGKKIKLNLTTSDRGKTLSISSGSLETSYLL